MADNRVGLPGIGLSLVLALLLAIVPLPQSINAARPHLLLLLVIYWSLSAPHLMGLAFAWVCGIALDGLKGTLLGQHALAFLLVAYVTHKFQLRMRLFPIYQQTLMVFALVAIYEGVVYVIDGFSDQAVTTASHWLPVLTSSLLWPLLVAALDTWGRRRRL
jgi:rod shape-determining protein MreD